MRLTQLQAELRWHEREAHRRFSLDRLLYAPPAFDALWREALDFLRPEPGMTILDLGCGEGKETAAFVAQGVAVVSVDLSHAQLGRARARLGAPPSGVTAHFVQADAQALPFAAAQWHVIYGKAIVHHLDLARAAAEIQRVLHPQGHASLAEPLAHHPLLALARWLSPHLRTPDERPLALAELAQFSDCPPTTYFLLAPLAYLFRWFPHGEAVFQWAHGGLQRLDAGLFARWPALKQWAWYAVLRVRPAPRGG
jgi:ubiquinone/menaquinone biosynthesis C-methylase UbiE